ncbi:hypothetical protein O3M35_009096 [Rhynocoris fuscipes]|uniref:Uncharacterized protein n=1 Tax=Rhynocoris fuscipes TaxID=488301 RepID=A0AAW1D4P3_9HEMI
MKFILFLVFIVLALMALTVQAKEYDCIPGFQQCGGTNSRCCGLYVCFNNRCIPTP